MTWTSAGLSEGSSLSLLSWPSLQWASAVRTDVVTSSTINRMWKGEPVVSGKKVHISINVLTHSHGTTTLFCFSYKNPGKPDGVNYIRTDEEVWNEGTSLRKSRRQGVPSRENDIPSWKPSGSHRKKDFQMTLQTWALQPTYLLTAFTVASSWCYLLRMMI